MTGARFGFCRNCEEISHSLNENNAVNHDLTAEEIGTASGGRGKHD
jgi:hypothetical protein